MVEHGWRDMVTIFARVWTQFKTTSGSDSSLTFSKVLLSFTYSETDCRIRLLVRTCLLCKFWFHDEKVSLTWKLNGNWLINTGNRKRPISDYQTLLWTFVFRMLNTQCRKISITSSLKFNFFPDGVGQPSWFLHDLDKKNCLSFDFCRFCVVIRCFHPRHNGQWPPTSKDFLSKIVSITFIFLF